MRIAIVDIDGTIADCTERAAKYLNCPKKDWDAFYNACAEDKPIKPIIELVQAIAKEYEILFLSGRRESCLGDTKHWIFENTKLFCFWCELRKDNDHRHDTIVKPELLDKFLAERNLTKDDIALILEDRNSMVSKWRELGFTCIQVADGDF